MPRVARLEHAQALVRFLMRACGGTCLLTMVCGLVASVVGTLVPLLCRPELHAVVPIFYLLSASMLLLILQCPFEVACHSLLRPQWVMLAWVLRALSIALLGLALVPSKGAAGMALAQLAGTVLAFLALGVFVVAQTQQALRRHTKIGS
jgi:O-antigen/teichoic acid export membrane protein